MSPSLILVIVLTLSFGFLNGMRDSSSIVATMISSRALSARTALGITAFAEFFGPFLFGTGVAQTIGGGIADPGALTLHVLSAGLGGAILWSLITWFFGLPGSSSHALIGGIVGAVWTAAGWEAIKPSGLYKIFGSLFSLPLIGFISGFIVLRLIYVLASHASPAINEFFKRAQIFTALGLAFSHGANDAQKSMGVITLGLLVAGTINKFSVPTWVILVSALAMSLGTLLGGWRLIRTLGGRFYKIRPVHGFAAQTTSTLVVLGASLIGLPASTTQVVSSAIVGVGSSERFGKVRWSVVDDILTSWIITIPASAFFAVAIYWMIQWLL